MSKKYKQISTFSLQGQFLSFELEDGYKIKRLNLATAEGEYCIKLSKEARASVHGVLTPGDWITVFGERSVGDDEVVKYKAYLIQHTGQTATAPTPTALTPTEPPVSSAKAKPKATILVCQKSDCMKRGGKAVCQALEQALSDRGLTDQVTIKGSGCMKQCKAAPNLVVMPAKARYSRVTAADVADLIDEHFPQQTRQPCPELMTVGTGGEGN